MPSPAPQLTIPEPRRRLRIGIDFDNTVADYDDVWRSAAAEYGFIPPGFFGGKTEVRTAIRAIPCGESHWQRLQGQVYGKLMGGAVLTEGAAEFLRRCRDDGDRVFIVSHKTEFGHFDPAQINLRDAAFSWMEEQGFFSAEGFAVDRSDVFFESTRPEKLARIGTLGLDHFIDDLPEILDDPCFPNGPTRHLFSGNWADISREVFGDAG